MTTKLKNLPRSAQKLWAQVSSTDAWSCEFVYEHGARQIWDAAIRHERKRLRSLLGIKHLPKGRTRK